MAGCRQRLVVRVLALLMAARMVAGGDVTALSAEPNIEIAKLWWPAPRNVWTPIGWKDHYFRFNVVYNGTLLAEPCPHWTAPRANAKPWLGQSVQLDFLPSPSGTPQPLPDKVRRLWRMDGGVGVQGWRRDHATPVPWTDWALPEGLVIRQEVFAHVPGGRKVETGIEPIYAWIRLSVTHVDELRAPKSMPVAVRLSKVHYFHDAPYRHEDGITIDVDPKLAPYSHELSTQRFDFDGKSGLRVIEPDGKVRMVVLPTDKGRVQFSETAPGSRVYALRIDMHSTVGDHVDLLLPMLPRTSEEIAAEEKVGFDRALAECDTFWSKTPATAARFEVPEEYINRAISQNLKFAEIIAEKDYKTADYSFLSGSWGYDNLWSTPTSMTSHMFLDELGYHDSVARHSELFRKHQGQNTPPGPSYNRHPGYFGTPRTLTAFDWLSDHGAILHQVSKHALLTGDQEFIDEWTEPIVKACDFIKDASQNHAHDGVPGLLPPAVATDEILPMQAVWSQAWNHKGLTTAVRLLERLEHPRAGEFDAFTAETKATFVAAYRERSAQAPLWTDDEGGRHPKPPTMLSSTPPKHHIFSDAFYLDTGPMVLVWAGLLPADDPLMQSSVKFFREGPNTRLRGPRVNSLSPPILEREISSCEPCYSWNLFHSWQLGDREHFLTGLYSLFAGGISPQTYISGEHRHGVYGNIFTFPLAFHMARLAVVDDEIAPGELHLLRLCPLAWCSTKKPATFERLPTEFGTVDLQFRLSRGGEHLDVSFRGDWRHTPKRIVLHAPPLPGLRTISVNGQPFEAGEPIELGP